MITCYFVHTCVDLTQKSGGAIVMEAFGAHFLKEISRTQLLSAAKRMLPREKKKYSGYEKSDFLVPLGQAFVESGIVKITKGAQVRDLSRSDVKKIGTF